MKKLVSLVVALVLLLSIGATTVNAVVETANLAVKLSASTAEVGEEVTVTVDWTEEMEGAEFILGYDKSVVEFVSASVADTFYTDEGDAVNVSWATMEEKPLTAISLTFKTVAEGSAKFTTSEATLVTGEIVNDELVSPETYSYGSATLTVGTFEEIPTPAPATAAPATATPAPATAAPATATSAPATAAPATATSVPATATPAPIKSDDKPTSIPQAGMDVAQYAIIAVAVVALVAAVAMIAKKTNK